MKKGIDRGFHRVERALLDGEHGHPTPLVLAQTRADLVLLNHRNECGGDRTRLTHKRPDRGKFRFSGQPMKRLDRSEPSIA